jgi:autotransporter-associated beta strand protein
MLLALLLVMVATSALHAEIAIQFDYTYDSGFFTNHPERRAVLEFAAEYVLRVTDDLEAITVPGIYHWDAVFWRPDMDATETIRNLEVPADTLLVYAGARNLDTAELGEAAPGWIGPDFYGSVEWQDTVEGRGEPGALAVPWATDFGPWGGSVAFDDETDTSWYFGLDPDGIGPGQYDFLSVAIHELGHVLGVGTADSWDAAWDWDDFFYGDAAMAEYGGSVPLHWDYTHWAEGTMSQVHGAAQEACMAPYIGAGERHLFTDLDFAGLADIGWDVTPCDNTWQGPGADWHLDANWDAGVTPGISQAAIFDTLTFRKPVVSRDMAVGRLEFLRAAWNISGTGSLTVYFGGIQSAGAGTNTVSVPLTMGCGFACTVAGGNTLALTGGLDAAGCALTKDGPGTLTLASASDLAGLDVQAGTLLMTGAAPLVTEDLTVDAGDGALLDLTENNLIVDYGPAPNPYDAVVAAVKNAWNSGAWDGAGITCDGDAATWALGVADNNDPGFAKRADLEGEPVDTTSVLVRYTFYGNANLDDRVDAADLSKLLGNFGTVPGSPADVMPWFLGNFNYDDRVDAADLSKLLGNWGEIEGAGGLGEGPAPVGGGVPTPEPATPALLALGAGAMLGRRRK